MEHQRRDAVERVSVSGNERNEQHPRSWHEVDDQQQVHEARTAAEIAVVGEEKYKAAVEKPKGEFMDDDEFFHVTCHIETGLKNKIAWGEYVELDRLLPRGIRMARVHEERRIQLIQHEGETYLAPASDRDIKINGICRWEQAFRVYAMIYCQANPTRSAEIWQYVHVINSAAAFYVWDNVAEYDSVFRQLMAQNPQRSWAKICTQMWNLALCEPLKKFSSKGTVGAVVWTYQEGCK